MPNQTTLGQVSVEVVADLDKLNSALTSSLGSAAAAGQKIGQTISAAVSTSLSTSFKPFEGQLGLFEQQTREAATRAGQNFSLFGEEIASIAVTSADSLAKIPQALTGAEAEKSLGYFENIRAHATLFRGAMENLATSLVQFHKPLTEIGTELQSLGGKMSIGVTAPLVALGAASLKSSADIDSLFRGLTAVAGSADGARKQFNELIEVAKLPGLGLEEAVQGSVRLQAFGFSSKEAKDALLAFGNAIATVGGGRSELDRVIVQLGQMAGAGKVLTQDLRPIIQTVPQVAAILKKEFGGDVLSEPAEKFAALGLSAKDVVQVLVTELGKLPKVTGGLKNDMENFSDSMKQSLAKMGDAIAPIAGPVMNGLASAVKTAVDLFTMLPVPLQGAAVAIAAVAAAAGPTIYALGTMARATADLISLGAKWAEWSRNAALAAEAAREVGMASTAASTAITGAGAAAQASTAGFGAMATAIGLVGQAAVLAAGAFAGFTLGQWLEENVGFIHEFSIRLADLVHGNHDLVESEAQLKEANASLEQSTESLAARLRQYGKDVERLDKETLMEYAKRLREIAAETSTVTTVFSNTGGSLNELSKGAKEAVSKYDELNSKWKEAKAVVSELTERQKLGENVTGALAIANKNLDSSYKALHPSVLSTTEATKQHTEHLKQQAAWIDQARNAMLGYTGGMIATEEELKKLNAETLKSTNISKDSTRVMENGVMVIRGHTQAVEENGKIIVKAAGSHDVLGSSVERARVVIGGMVSLLPAGAAGLDQVAASAITAAAAVREVTAEMQLAATAAKNMADMAQGFKASNFSASDFSGGNDGIVAGSGTMVMPEASGLAPANARAGDIKAITGVGGTSLPMGGTARFNQLEITTWTEEEIEAAKKLREAMAALAAAGFAPTLNEALKLQKQMMNTGQTMSEVIAQWKALGEANAATKNGVEALKKATDSAAPSIQDLQDQLWRLIDAGQGNTMAAWDLRTRIENLTGSYTSQAKAANDANTAVKNASGGFTRAADMITEAAKKVDAATKIPAGGFTQKASPTTAAASTFFAGGGGLMPGPGGGPTPYYGPTGEAPYTYIPSGPYQPGFDQSAYQPGLGSQPLTIVIEGGGSAANAGQKLTQVLRQQAGYV